MIRDNHAEIFRLGPRTTRSRAERTRLLHLQLHTLPARPPSITDACAICAAYLQLHSPLAPSTETRKSPKPWPVQQATRYRPRRNEQHCAASHPHLAREDGTCKRPVVALHWHGPLALPICLVQAPHTFRQERNGRARRLQSTQASSQVKSSRVKSSQVSGLPSRSLTAVANRLAPSIKPTWRGSCQAGRAA